MTKAQDAVVVLCFALGIGLIVFGSTHHADMTVWGLSLHARLVKALGLLTTLGGVVTLFALYGASLPPTRYELERRTGPDPHGAMEGATPPHATSTGHTASHGVDHNLSRPVVSLTPTNAEARLRLATKRKKRADRHSTSTSDSNTTT